MKWVIIAVRTLVGAGFVFTGLDGFLHFMPMPPMPEGDTATLGRILTSSGWMYAVKACELLGGLMLISGRMAPLGITLLMPVAVNILLFELCVSHQPGPGVVLVLLLLFLIWGYRSTFLPVLMPNARIG